MKSSKVIGILLTPFKTLGCFVVKLLFSSHLRRLFFMTFVYGMTKGSKELHLSELVKSKPILDVVNDTEALAIPIIVYSWLWNKEDQGTLHLESEATFTESCKELIDHIPAWMRYGTIGFMLDDGLRIYRDFKENNVYCQVDQPC